MQNLNFDPSSNIKTISVVPGEPLAQCLYETGAVWLDSSARSGEWGERSILARRPSGEIRFGGGLLVVRSSGRTVTRRTDIAGALAALDQVASGEFFYAIGYIGYEATLPFLGLRAVAEAGLPDLHFFLYDPAEVIEQADCTGLELSRSDTTKGSSADCAHISPTLSYSEYVERIERIKHHIHEGDIYQANFTCRFDVRSAASPQDVYSRLRRLNPAPYSAFMNFGEYQVLSSSPERMLFRDGSSLTTSPIKGTVARGRSAMEDEENTARLLASEKDCAEHLMIVDLERNDLGKIARMGSVSVDALFRPEKQASMIHLVSDISARIDPKMPMSDVFTSLLPGGSITGAPKRRAVEIIGQAEATPRSVYTGCIGYMHGSYADFNIAIRTIIHDHGTYYVHAGGGIVADSDPEAEYQEMLLKASNLFRATGVAEDEIACLSR